MSTDTDTDVDETVDPEPIHGWFGLSYASWLVLPRVVMEAMPQEWQARMVDLLREIDSTYDWLPRNSSPHVVFRDSLGYYASIPRELSQYRWPDREWLDRIKVK